MLGRAENTKNSNINLNQMGSNGTHKNKTYLPKEKNSKVHIRIGKCTWKNLYLTEAPWYHGINAKKTEFNPSDGCGAMSKNAHLVHFRTLLLIAP